MAKTQTTRLNIFRWSSGADAFTRSDMDTSHSELESRVAGYNQAGSRPTAAAAYAGFFHYDSTTGSVGQISYCNGTAWFDLAKPGAAVAIDGTLANGSSTDVARADHKHSISNNTITGAMMADNAIDTAELADDAVTTVKILNANVTNDKLAASGLDAGKLTTGTLPIARIGSSAVANAYLGSDIDAGKLGQGQLPVARIAAGTITLDKMANSAGLSVVGRSANSSGAIADITAGNDNEVLLRNGTSLAFAKIDSDNITANAVDVEHMQQVSGHAILARVGSSTANLTQITSGDEEVLGRTGGGNLAFGKVTNAQLAGSITTDKITSLDGAKITGTVAVGQLPTTIPLGTNTTGSYVATIAAGTNISVSGSGSETAAVTVNHATMTSPTPSSNANAGSAITTLTISNGHVTDYTYYDFDARYYTESESRVLFTDSTRKSYGGSTSTSRNSNAYHNIFVTGSSPSTTGAKAGDIWFET